MKKETPAPPPRRRPERTKRPSQAAIAASGGPLTVGDTSYKQWLIVGALFFAMTVLLMSFTLDSYTKAYQTAFATVVAPAALVGIIWAFGLMTATFVTVALIFFLFTPYTHQLDEIKNLLLMSLPPVLLAAAAWRVDFSRFKLRRDGATILLGIFTLLTFVSFFVNMQFWLVGERVVWFQLACATFTVIFAWFMTSEMEMRRVMAFFVILCFFSAVLGLLFYAGHDFTGWMGDLMQKMNKGYPKNDPFWTPQALNLMETLSKSREMYSTILNSDFYAAFLVMTIWLPLGMFFVEEHAGYKILAIATFLLMLICLAFTNSNDSYFAFGVLGTGTFILLTWRHIREWMSRRLLITFLVGSAILGITLLILMIPTLDRGWDFKTEAYAGRQVLWGGGFWPWLYGMDHTAAHLDFKSILFGTGPGGYRFYFPVFRSPIYFDTQINNVTTFGHNWYLDVLLEFGAFGLLAFLAFHIRVMVDSWRQIHSTANRAHMLYQIAIFTGLVSIAFQNFFSPNNRWAVCGVIYWALFGLSMGVKRLDDQPEGPEVAAAPVPENHRRFQMVARYALLVVAGIFCLRSIPQSKKYFEAARANGTGLIYMEYAEDRERKGLDGLPIYQLARDHFEKAIALNPSFGTSYYKLGHIYNTLASYEEGPELFDKAIETYETLNRINPHYSEVHLNLGIMYSLKVSREENPEEKLRLMEKAYDEIREAARQAWKPNIQWVAAAIGRQLVPMVQMELADPSLSEDKRAALQARVSRLNSEILGYYRKIVEYEPKLQPLQQDRKKYLAQAQAQIVKLAAMSENTTDSIQLLSNMYMEDPTQTAALDALLGLYDLNKQPEKKIDFLLEAIHASPLDVSLRKQIAQVYFEQNRMEDFVRELRRILVLSPNDNEALADLMLVARQDGNEADALDYARRLSAAGGHPEAVTGWSIGSTPLPAGGEKATTGSVEGGVTSDSLQF